VNLCKIVLVTWKLAPWASIIGVAVTASMIEDHSHVYPPTWQEG
jgi:hypothetical protein